MSDILCLMFHRVYEPRLGYTPEAFYRFIDTVCEQYTPVLPFEAHEQPAVVLTFDDAYYDFYHYVFPKLQEWQIRAVLAVSPLYIHEKSTVTPQKRLNAPYPEAMFENKYHQDEPFCSWEEICEMQQSGLVEIAAHGYRHDNLKKTATDFQQEVVYSKKILEAYCPEPIRGFIYPFGQCSRERHQKVLQHYDYAMRIGSAINKNWRNTLYRVDAENYWPTLTPITSSDINKWRRKYWLNRLRGK